MQYVLGVLDRLLCSLGFSLLFSHLLPYAEGNTAVVQRLVSIDSHTNLIPNPQQKQPPLRPVHRDLPNKLVERLGVKVLTDGAQASLTGLALKVTAVEVLLKGDDVMAGGGVLGDVLHPGAGFFHPLSAAVN